MNEIISDIKKTNEKQNEKIEETHKIVSGLTSKIIGSVGALIVIAQVIINFVKWGIMNLYMTDKD